MQSFRTEIEYPIVERDIVELANKIALFHNVKIDKATLMCQFAEASNQLKKLSCNIKT